MRIRVLSTSAVVSLSTIVSASLSAQVPEDLVVDVRIFEARSSTPNFALFEDLSFFVDTDGTSVTEEQWLATLARQVPETFLAVLASDTLSVDGEQAAFEYELRSRGLELAIDLSGFDPEAVFPATVRGRFTDGESEMKALERELELRAGMTYVWSSPKLELSASEYLSLFREYEDRDHRGRVYEYLRDYVVFLVVAVTPRIDAEGRSRREPVEVSLPDGAELPELVSPAGVELVGTVVLEFDVAEDGTPGEPTIALSTVPEVTPRLLGALAEWRFPEAAGSRARLTLEPRASR